MIMGDARKSLRALFDEVSEIQSAEGRRAFLDQTCGDATALRAEVEELLRADETAGGFLADPKRDASLDSVPVTLKEGDQVGRYRLVEKIGEGGCGVVYLAEQTEPVRRRVALKVIKLGMDTRSVIARFEAERQALAMMDHPNIARVLDAGATETGRPFFVMELVSGIKITDYCAQKQLSIAERLRLFIQVCHAVQHAHQKGIIHRDLKPSNVLVASNDGVPLPKVIDFGVAKATAGVQLTDQTLSTRFGLLVGTPAYMSPEQAELGSTDVDTRTDIYSLGVLLYELLTGHPPFNTDTWLKSGVDTLRKAIRETPPKRPSTRLALELSEQSANENQPSARRNPQEVQRTIQSVRGDLDWIVLKALEKDRARRYETANAFAMDIQRHLDNEPVVARPPNPLYLFRKLVRRHRPAFAAAAAVAMLLMAGIVFSLRDAARTRDSEKIQRGMRERAELARSEADAANTRLRRTLYHREWQDAEAALEQGKTGVALAWFARAVREHPDDVAVRTRLLSMLTENSFARPLSQPVEHGSPVRAVSFSSDGQRIVSAAADGQVRLWTVGGEIPPLVLPERFSAPSATFVTGDRVLVDEEKSISLWHSNGTLIKRIELPHPVSDQVPVTPDGRFVALRAGNGGPQVWDAATLTPVGRPFEDASPDFALGAINADGGMVFGYDTMKRTGAWEVSSGRRVWRAEWKFSSGWDLVAELAVHPNNHTLAVGRITGPVTGDLEFWDAPPDGTGQGLRTNSDPAWVLPTQIRLTALAYSRDGKKLFTGNLEGGYGVLREGEKSFQAFNGEHKGRVECLAVSPDGRRLATGSVDGTVCVWDVSMRSPSPLVVSNGPAMWDAKFSPDSTWFVMAGTNAVEIRDTTTGVLRHRMPINGFISRVNVSPDGRRVIACTHSGAVGVWDSATGQPVFPLLTFESAHYVEFSPDGRWIAVTFESKTIRVLDAESGRAITPVLTNAALLIAARFTPDSRMLVAMTEWGGLDFYSLPDGRRLDRPARHKDVIWALRFSSDGKRMLTASRDHTAAIWNIETGELIRSFPQNQPLLSCAFSPDDERIITSDAGRMAHVWDVANGSRLFLTLPHPGAVWYCLFSPDGRTLLTGDDAGNARHWDAETGLPLSGWIRNGRCLKRTLYSPNGKYALSCAEDGGVKVWPIVIATQPAPAWLPDLAEAIAGRRLRDDGSVETVSAERWTATVRELGGLTGNDFYGRWARWFLVERMQDEPAVFAP